MPGMTVKLGMPNSEVYIGNASLYAEGGPFEGYEPMLVSTEILATTGCTLVSMASPIVGAAVGCHAACKSTQRIVKTVSAPFFARWHAHVTLDMSIEEFDKNFEEEVIKEGEIPGIPGALRVTYRLKNKRTGEIYEASYDASDVTTLATVVASAVNGFKEASKAAKAPKTSSSSKSTSTKKTASVKNDPTDDLVDEVVDEGQRTAKKPSEWNVGGKPKGTAISPSRAGREEAEAIIEKWRKWAETQGYESGRHTIWTRRASRELKALAEKYRAERKLDELVKEIEKRALTMKRRNSAHRGGISGRGRR